MFLPIVVQFGIVHDSDAINHRFKWVHLNLWSKYVKQKPNFDWK